MNVLVFGAGALGSLLGAHLAGKHSVTLVGRAPHIEAVRKAGLQVEGVRKFMVKPEALTEVDASSPADLVLVAVKSYDTRDAAKALGPIVSESTRVLTVQNGLGNYEALKEDLPRATVLASSCTYAAMMAGPGRIAYMGKGEILLGGTVRELSVTGAVARVLRDAGLQALGVPDIRGPLWQKAIVNAAINPLTALTGKTNGALLEDPQLLERMKRVVDEAAAVARALRVPLPERDVFAVVRRVAEASASNRSSMLEDLSRGRRTEVEAINGVFVSRGKELGIPTPENEALLKAVRARGKNA